MITQSELRRYSKLKEEVKEYEKNLKSRLSLKEEVQHGNLIASVEHNTVCNTSWKDVAINSANYFKIKEMKESLDIIKDNYDKASQPHIAPPALKVETESEHKERIEKKSSSSGKKDFESYLI